MARGIPINWTMLFCIRALLIYHAEGNFFRIR